jgi:hypothetical protein
MPAPFDKLWATGLTYDAIRWNWYYISEKSRPSYGIDGRGDAGGMKIIGYEKKAARLLTPRWTPKRPETLHRPLYPQSHCLKPSQNSLFKADTDLSPWLRAEFWDWFLG